jgi:aspartyl-tRNA(Asn)/glutamyl-tRNA(Gln) amidotransferase subunit A
MRERTCYLSIGAISQRLRAQDISPVELIDVCLTRIDTINPSLNAFITVLTDQAREQAEEAAAAIKAGKWRGPLHGIPVGIKDFYDTAKAWRD